MPRLFLDIEEILTNTVEIEGENARHIGLSLRMTIGESVVLCDRSENEYDAEIVSFADKKVFLKIKSKRKSQSEPSYKAVLYQALPKGDKMEYIIQKAVELGVDEIVPFESSRCVVKLNAEKDSKKNARWQKIADAAAAQSGRAYRPRVRPVMNFSNAVSEFCQNDLPLFCYEGEGVKQLGDIIKTGVNCKSFSIMIGPEGGFSDKEVNYAKDKGAVITGLGKRILRTETASCFVLSCLCMVYDN